MPTPRLPTHCSRTCAPCEQGAGPQISKLLSEAQPSWGLRAEGWGLASHCRAPSPSARALGPGPSRGTRLGLISCPAPSPNGLQLHKHSQNSEPALSGAPRPQPQHSWPPHAPKLGTAAPELWQLAGDPIPIQLFQRWGTLDWLGLRVV